LAPVVLIAGPTASGKSGLALELAAALRGTIINADSLQAYRDLHILSAGPDDLALARVPHRLYGYLDAAERGSVGRWRALALTEIAAAHAAGRLPIVVGGTGLYLRALQHGLAAIPAIPAAIRVEAAELYRVLGGPAFRERLAALDPAGAARLPPGDRHRETALYSFLSSLRGTAAGGRRRPAPSPPGAAAGALRTPPRHDDPGLRLPKLGRLCDLRHHRLGHGEPRPPQDG
jgi:tRNA dimethylallyltransferase